MKSHVPKGWGGGGGGYWRGGGYGVPNRGLLEGGGGVSNTRDNASSHFQTLRIQSNYNK